MFCHFGSKIRFCGNRCRTLIFKDKDNGKRQVYSEKNLLQNCISDLLNFENFEILRFFQHFFLFLQNNPPKFQIKKRNISTRRASKECMYQVSSNSPQKRGFYSILNVKNGFFSGHLDVIPCISIYSFYSDFYATNDVLKSFFAF